MAKNTKRYRRPSLIVTGLLLSTALLTLSPANLSQKGNAGLAYAQARGPAPTKDKPRNRKSGADAWYVFKSPDGDFRLAFPIKPKLQDITSGPATLIRSFAVTTEDGTNFSINFHDIGGDPTSSENNEWSRELEEVMAVADRNQNIEIIRTHRLAKNIIEAELLQAVAESGSNINYLRRSILRRARVYTLACGPVIHNKKVDRPLCEKFFNSIRFMSKRRRR